MIKFEIKNRWSGEVQFTAEIDCEEGAVKSLKVGLAIRWAIKSGAYLRDANLSGADLRDANLSGANLRYANLIHAGIRSDGYEFFASIKEGKLWIKAGGRHFNIDDARQHWTETRAGTPLGEETFSILDNAERLTNIRRLIPAEEKKAAAE